MTKVLHIIDAETPADMLDQLTLLAGDGDVVASVGPAPQHSGFDLPIRGVHCPLGVAKLAVMGLHKLAASVDQVHAWSPRAGQAAGALAGCLERPPVLSLPCAAVPGRIRQITTMVTRTKFAVTVPTQADRAAMIRAGLSDSKVHVLPPAVDFSKFDDMEESRQRVRDALGITDEQRLLVAPSQMIRGAGHKYASWAHAIVRQIRDDLLLMMPGGGPIIERVKCFAATTGYDAEVLLTGDRFTLAEALAAADAAVFFAEHDVGVGALAAAMAAGVPIAASNTPAIAQCAPHDVAALLAAPDDPRAASAVLLQLVEDSQLAARLAGEARKLAKRLFDRQNSRQRLMEIYSQAPAAQPA